MTDARGVLARGLELLALAMAGIAALAMAGIVLITMTSVMLRRFANTPLHLTEDVVGLMLSAALFLALPLVTLRSQHIRVSIVVEALGPRFKAPMRIAAMCVGLVFFGWIVWVSVPWLDFAWQRNLKTETARILLYPWMATLPLSLGLVWLILLARMVGIIEHEPPADPEKLADFTASREGH